METSENFKLLGVINGIYNLGEETQEFNSFYTLFVYVDDDKDLLKIDYLSMRYEMPPFSESSNPLEKFDGEAPLINTKKGSTILDNIGPLELELIVANFDKRVIKELIFKKFLDFLDDYLTFESIY